MGVVVGEIARENDLPQSLLVPRATLERVAREVPGRGPPSTRRSSSRTGAWSSSASRCGDFCPATCGSAIEGYIERDPKIRLLP